MTRLSVAFLLILACALPALADDGPATAEKQPAAGKDAATDFATAMKAWPAPSEESAFTVELVAVLGESPMGTYLVEATPAVVEGKVVGWRIHERLALDFGEREAAGDAVYTVGLDFTPREGRSAENFDGKATTDAWTVADGTITITHTVEDAEPTTKTVDAAAGLFPGKAGMFLAARFMPAAAATVRGQDFSPTDDDHAIAEFNLVVDPQAWHDGVKVMSLDGRRGNKRIQLFVDPKTREILHGTLSEEGSPMRLTLVPRASAPEKDDIFAREARTAAEGSAKALYAITVKDKALIDKAFRWSTMHAETKKQLEAAGQEVPTLEAFRAATLEQLSAGKPDPNTTPGQIRAGLQMYVGKVRVQDTPQGWKAVLWPPSFGSLLVVMEKKDDGWKAIGLRKLGN